MIRIRQIKVSVSEKEDILEEKIEKKINRKDIKILSYKISKKSIDARKKPEIYYIYEVNVEVDFEESLLKKNKDSDIFKIEKEKYLFKQTGDAILDEKPVIVGSGPCGLFCAYILAENGYKPIVIEQGAQIDKRVKIIDEFNKTNKLDLNTNIQFGEGGAGTFSDGKLNTQIKDRENRKLKVLETFYKYGSPVEIMYENKPHIGTDVLRKVIKNMREDIIRMGGEFRFETKLTNIKTKDNKLVGVELNNKEILKTNLLVLAIGHSARDTFHMLYDNGINMESKPFALGIRIQHKQDIINTSQYGNKYKMPPASYKLTHQTKDKRGVYTFCMCPGGYVVNASSEEGYLAINGMSNYKRESENANSAVVVTVNKKDFGEGVFAGVNFQKKLEKKAYNLGEGYIPTQLFKDYVENKKTKAFRSIKPIFSGKYNFANLNELFPDYINDALKEGIYSFGKKIKGFSQDDAILSGIESRTSSPIKIIRDSDYQSNIKGIYPAGEGAGYAGGITSAAIDGIKIAEQIGRIYKPNKNK